MNLIELGSVLGSFFESGAGPTHDELDRAVHRVGLQGGDPAPGGRSPTGPLGKTKRIRELMVHATDHDSSAGIRLAKHIVDLLRADGAFEQNLPGYAGPERAALLKIAFSRLGFTMDSDGGLRPTVIDNLTGSELTDALRGYVNRINLNPDDAPLQVGTGKELDEAAARYVLLDRLGEYPIGGQSGSFPATLARAFTALGLEVAPDITRQLHADPRRQVHQCLFLLGLAVNRLRNDAGTGHGRPDAPRKSTPLTTAESRLIARATALLAGMLLDS